MDTFTRSSFSLSSTKIIIIFDASSVEWLVWRFLWNKLHLYLKIDRRIWNGSEWFDRWETIDKIQITWNGTKEGSGRKKCLLKYDCHYKYGTVRTSINFQMISFIKKYCLLIIVIIIIICIYWRRQFDDIKKLGIFYRSYEFGNIVKWTHSIEHHFRRSQRRTWIIYIFASYVFLFFCCHVTNGSCSNIYLATI